MDFRDAVAADIDNVFFNTAEFAEVVIFDGKEVPIILDDDVLAKISEDFASLGLAAGEQHIFIKEKDMHRLPQPGDKLTKDGRDWYVIHATSNMGVYALRIGINQNQNYR